jgi:hypothetical protein
MDMAEIQRGSVCNAGRPSGKETHPTVVPTSIPELARGLQSAGFVGYDMNSDQSIGLETAADDVHPIVVADTGVGLLL